MASYIYPPEHPEEDLYTFVNHESLLPNSQLAVSLLQRFPDLFVPKVQMKSKGNKNTCWYVAFKEFPDKWIMNFTILPSDLNVELRGTRFFEIRDFHHHELDMQFQKNLPYFKCRKIGLENMVGVLEEYLCAIAAAVAEGKLKSPSKSSAEYFIVSDLRKSYPEYKFRHGERPVANGRGGFLELDIYVKELSIAIEVQGPTHYQHTDIYKNYDQVKNRDEIKKTWCFENDVKLIHIDWDAYMRTLYKLPPSQRQAAIKRVFDDVVRSDGLFFEYRISDFSLVIESL